MAPPFSSSFVHKSLLDGTSHCVQLSFCCFLWLIMSIQITRMPGHGRWWVSRPEKVPLSLLHLFISTWKRRQSDASEMQRIRQCSVMTFFTLKCLLIYPTIAQHQEIQYWGRTMILTYNNSSTLMLWTLLKYTFKIFLLENYSWSFYSLSILLKSIGNSFKALGHLGSYLWHPKSCLSKGWKNMAFMYKQ